VFVVVVAIVPAAAVAVVPAVAIVTAIGTAIVTAIGTAIETVIETVIVVAHLDVHLIAHSHCLKLSYSHRYNCFHIVEYPHLEKDTLEYAKLCQGHLKKNQTRKCTNLWLMQLHVPQQLTMQL